MKMKKLLLCCAGALILFMIPFTTSGIELADNFDLYGFVKLDMHYQDGGMNSVLAPRYAKAGDGNLASTAMNTRFGFKWNGGEIGTGWKIAAQLEWDLFDGASANQMKFRTRHANFTLAKGSSKLLFGQFWDLFAPLGPTTLMTNGYFWQVGNVGFRRAQIRYTYSSGKVNFAVSANDPTSATGRAKKMPIMEARLGFDLGAKGKMKIGVSGAYGMETYTGVGYATDVNIMGVCVDWHIPLGALVFRGEATCGENLKNFLSRENVYDNIVAKEFEAKKVNSLWTQLLYKIKKYNIWVGYSFENLTEDGQLTPGELQDASCLFAGIKLAAGGGVSIGLEYANFLSKYYLGIVDFKTNQIILSFIYGF
jgi:hypothetical protein